MIEWLDNEPNKSSKSNGKPEDNQNKSKRSSVKCKTLCGITGYSICDQRQATSEILFDSVCANSIIIFVVASLLK